MGVNTNRFTEKSQEAVLGAQQLAESLNHSQVEPEHLLAVLLRQADGLLPQLLGRAGANTQQIQQQLEAELNRLPKATGAWWRSTWAPITAARSNRASSCH